MPLTPIILSGHVFHSALLSLRVSSAAAFYEDVKKNSRAADRGAALAKIMTLFAERLHINHFGNLLLERAPSSFFFFLPFSRKVHARFVIYRRLLVIGAMRRTPNY